MSFLPKTGFGIFLLAAAATLYPVMTAPRMPSEAYPEASEDFGQSSNTASIPSESALDFDFFKTNVEAIFVKERPGHARCYACHSEPGRIFHLEKLSAGSVAWTESNRAGTFRRFPGLSHPVIPTPVCC